jgi:hypothetical protein
MEIVALPEFNQLNRSTNRVSTYFFLIVFVTGLLCRQIIAPLEANPLNRSTNQVSSYSFLDCFRNGPSVSADGDGSTAGVQPTESIDQPSKQLFFS